MSVASTCVGTPLYLAPELCEGKEYNNKCDVWALGAILYELCALSPPFLATSMPALVMMITRDDPPPLADTYSTELDGLMRRCVLSASHRPLGHSHRAHPLTSVRVLSADVCGRGVFAPGSSRNLRPSASRSPRC